MGEWRSYRVIVREKRSLTLDIVIVNFIKALHAQQIPESGGSILYATVQKRISPAARTKANVVEFSARATPFKRI